jgi:hypothetical protein
MSPLLAQSRHGLSHCTCPLLGVKPRSLFSLNFLAFSARAYVLTYKAARQKAGEFLGPWPHGGRRATKPTRNRFLVLRGACHGARRLVQWPELTSFWRTLPLPIGRARRPLSEFREDLHAHQRTSETKRSAAQASWLHRRRCSYVAGPQAMSTMAA